VDPGVGRSRGIAEGWGELGVVDLCVGCSRGIRRGGLADPNIERSRGIAKEWG
jgi:hypothetical protein